MSSAGLSHVRLGRLREVLAGHVERGAVPGVLTLVQRRGEVHADAIGTLAAGGGAPVQRDTIFRIASMTKPIAAAAALLLLHQGRHGSERILSRPTVEAMTTNQLTPEQQAGAGVFLGDNRGWGLGVSIILRRDDVSAAPGRFGWDGGLGTSWASDPREDLVAILMTQVMGFPSGIDLDFWTSVYQAIED